MLEQPIDEVELMRQRLTPELQRSIADGHSNRLAALRYRKNQLETELNCIDAEPNAPCLMPPQYSVLPQRLGHAHAERFFSERLA